MASTLGTGMLQKSRITPYFLRTLSWGVNYWELSVADRFEGVGFGDVNV